MAQDAPRPVFMRYWLPVLMYVGLIFVLSAQPRLKPPFKFESSDKVAHVIEYGGLGFLLARALRTVPMLRGIALPSLVAVAIGFCIGGSDELFQSTVPGRDSSTLDLIADTIGLSIAQLVYLWVRRP